MVRSALEEGTSLHFVDGIARAVDRGVKLTVVEGIRGNLSENTGFPALVLAESNCSSPVKMKLQHRFVNISENKDYTLSSTRNNRYMSNSLPQLE